MMLYGIYAVIVKSPLAVSLVEMNEFIHLLIQSYRVYKLEWVALDHASWKCPSIDKTHAHRAGQVFGLQAAE